MNPLLPSACLPHVAEGHLALTLQIRAKCCTIRRYRFSDERSFRAKSHKKSSIFLAARKK